ncbi:PIN domain-containing protein [Methanococcoides methylutens]|uniref:PIN domain-containing protein n=1 Tax=Methanococcoides methylutens TaxID=2226 RepID=UPI0040448A13
MVPDTSVIIDGLVSEMIVEGDYEGVEIFIPEAMVSELESQANRGLEIGNKGLDELKKLQEMAKEGLIDVSFTGERPTIEERRYAKEGAVDAIIRSCAEQLDATFVTGTGCNTTLLWQKEWTLSTFPEKGRVHDPAYRGLLY